MSNFATNNVLFRQRFSVLFLLLRFINSKFSFFYFIRNKILNQGYSKPEFHIYFLDNFYNDEAGSDQWKRSDDSQRVDFGEMMKRALEDDDFML